jgi:hypothetical protein
MPHPTVLVYGRHAAAADPCFGPVPGSTAASAVLIGALADEPPPNNRQQQPAGRGALRDTRGRVWSPRRRATGDSGKLSGNLSARAYFQDLINALALASVALMIRSRLLRASRTLLVRSEKRIRLAGPRLRARLR